MKAQQEYKILFPIHANNACFPCSQRAAFIGEMTLYCHCLRANKPNRDTFTLKVCLSNHTLLPETALAYPRVCLWQIHKHSMTEAKAMLAFFSKANSISFPFVNDSSSGNVESIFPLVNNTGSGILESTFPLINDSSSENVESTFCFSLVSLTETCVNAPVCFHIN